VVLVLLLLILAGYLTITLLLLVLSGYAVVVALLLGLVGYYAVCFAALAWYFRKARAKLEQEALRDYRV
jgi:hypothetical protein